MEEKRRRGVRRELEEMEIQVRGCPDGGNGGRAGGGQETAVRVWERGFCEGKARMRETETEMVTKRES
eukprot:759438-Hanusia_phi.AAC.4